MIFRDIILLLFVSFFFSSVKCFSQKRLDSISKLSFNELSDKVFKGDSVISYLSSKAYLFKAKKIRDSIKIANGYFFLSATVQNINIEKKDSLRLKYNDSIIYITKNLINHEFYPSYAYLNKGDIYYLKENFKKALDNYLLAINTSNKEPSFTNFLKHRIGIIKLRFGKNEESLKLFKELNHFYQNHSNTDLNNKDYLFMLFSLGDAYARNHFLDSAGVYYDLGYNKSLNLEDKKFKSYFILGKGVLEFHKNNIQASIDSIEKSIPDIISYKDLPNTAYGYFFLGKAYHQLKETNKGISYFKKVDSIFNIVNDLHPDLRGNYEYLISYAKEQNKKSDQLKYIKQLLKLDGKYRSNYDVISEKLNVEYDLPILFKKRDELIESLKVDAIKTNRILLASFLISIFLSGIAFYQYNKRRKYYQRYLDLINNSNFTVKNSGKSSNKDLNISKEIVEHIESRLVDFEKNKRYLDNEVRLSKLSKEFNTNERYLSSVINNKKSKNFKTYLNDLRIEYAIDRIKNNKMYRKFTIVAIANEVGFNNAESFSKSFHAKTGIYPSYFIREILK